MYTTKKLLQSPTLMSWISLITKSLSFFLVIPLMVTHYAASDIALWYLFVSAINFQMLADLGFSSTFIRVFSYCRGGLSIDDMTKISTKTELAGEDKMNQNSAEAIWQVMNHIYIRLSLIFFVFISVSSYLLINPIMASVSPSRSAVAWIVIILTSFVQLRFSVYSNFLQGMNKIALVKKWETLFNILNIISNSLILYLGGDILLLVISNQIWALITILRDYFIVRKIEDNFYLKRNTKSRKIDSVFKIVWPSAWKSGVGVLMSVGLMQLTNMFYAKGGQSEIVASYLLGYNLIRQISTFSQSAFYSKIPELSRLRAKNDMEKLITVSKKGMLLTYWSFVILVICFGLFGKFGLHYIKSNINFPTQILWASISIGILFERFGAMHIQILSTTNKIVWHIANGITGLIYLIIFFSLHNTLGIYIFPVALITSNILFYSWYCAYLSYKSLKVTFFNFEKNIFLPALTLMLVYLAVFLFA